SYKFSRHDRYFLRIAPRTFIGIGLFTANVSFTREGIINVHNLHPCADENTNLLRVANSKYHFSINIWAGIIGNEIIGLVIPLHT
ncbi:MAG: hypothetical protein KTM48_04085, partial [Wolbachia endosymbiont of Pissodes strobi]|nr:hypothetical protein [Wolbachia endosymbiont of Pissodes strobi]